MKRILVTGGAGFISSNMIRYLLHRTSHDVVTMDALTYAGNMANLADVRDHERLRFIHGDIRDLADVASALEGVDVIVNAAAESHVSKSIAEGGAEFVTTNVVGTQVLMDAMREHPVERFVLISSSEVYGTAEGEPMTEEHPLNPRSPYAGTKAGGDRLAYSYWCTYDLPITIIRPFNNYGPFQHPEKVIPRFIIQALCDRPLTIHGEGHASRDWLHVFDTAEAITAACEVPLERHRGRDDQRRHRRRRDGRADRRHDPRHPGQAGDAQAARGRPAGTGRPPHRLHRQGGAAARVAIADPLRRGAGAHHPLVQRESGMVAGRPVLGADGAGRLTRPRTLVVLGGGPAQRHAIDAARALGVRTIVCDADPRLADVPVSSEDGDGIRRTAREADGLIAPGTDWPVRIAAAAAEDLHIPHPIPASVGVTCTDKIAQRIRLDAAGVPQPRWSPDAPPAYPCVVKAADRQGQRAMTIVRDAGGLDEATERARRGSRTGRVIYEEFVPGPEVTVNAFSIDGRFFPVTVTDRIHFEGVPGVARRHVYPAAADGAGAAAAVAEAAVAAVGITSGPSYVQLILADDGPRVVEVAARLGGGHDSEICRAAAGVDLAAAAVLAAVGEPVDPEDAATPQRTAPR